MRRALIALLLALGTLLAFTLWGPEVHAFPRDAWRINVVCEFSHAKHVDPIVYPGQRNASHLHDFFGNRSTDESPFVGPMRKAPSTCALSRDRSAYWAPAIRNTVTGKVRHALKAQVYVQNKGKVAGMRAWPVGFRALSYVAETPPYSPLNGPGIRIRFDEVQCWDGVTPPGDRYDGSGHTTSALAGGSCPDAFPVLLPHLHVNFRYGPAIAEKDWWKWEPVRNVEPHADFMNVWDQKLLRRVVSACLTQRTGSQGCGLLTDENVREKLQARLREVAA